MGMAYDAAHSEVVLFSGCCDASQQLYADTWTWGGAGWVQRSPAHMPPPRANMGMAYDAARGQVVLFGGFGESNPQLADTWTWDGTDWTLRTPVHTPRGRNGTGMAYDAAHGRVVLFGGAGGYLNDTWTWNGSDWTELFPVHAPSPRYAMGMAIDPVANQVVLFGGLGTIAYADTWSWNGSDWIERSPVHAPSPRYDTGMTNDDARGQVLLFGGFNYPKALNDTWTSDDADWLERVPTHHPSKRSRMGMAYDAARGQVVLFGGCCDAGGYGPLGDTWIWDSSGWAIPYRAEATLTPRSGAPGTEVAVDGTGFGANEKVVVTFIDSTTGTTTLRSLTTDGIGGFSVQVTIPLTATPGRQVVKVKAVGSGQTTKRTFTVT
jgi:hypothetical protein